MPRLVLIGGGGHCKSVIDTIRAGGAFELGGILDRADRVGEEVLGVRIVGTDESLDGLKAEGVDACFVSLGSIGPGGERRRLFAAARSHGFDIPAIIHPSAFVSPTAVLDPGVFVGANATIGADAHVGTCAIINTGAVVEHDCIVGDFAHVAPGAALSGGVMIGEGAHVGTGAAVVQGVTIGADALIGAGSAVTEDVRDGVVAFGNPCREIPRDG